MSRAPVAPDQDPRPDDPARQSPFYRMNRHEAAWGWVPGWCAGPRYIAEQQALPPIAALEEAIRPALLRPPCVVQFSGGRDSSVMLAVATRLARKEGLPEPIARTQRFPGLSEAGEDEWQEMVVRHLGVREWERIDVDDELDLLGPVAAPSLLRHGLLWPPMVHARHFDLAPAAGGSIIDGEGGDEVLGAGRMAPLVAVASGLARPGASMMKQLVFALSPRPLRRQGAMHAYRGLRSPWLRPGAWRDLHTALADDVAGEPANRRRALFRHLCQRGVVLFQQNFSGLAAEHEVLDLHPFLDPSVVASLAVAGGRFGFAGRTTAMTHLFADLLPDEVLRRSTKARFNRCAFCVHSRAFAASWDGRGIDEDLVEPELLARAWAAEEPSFLSFALLQAAWLATR